MSARDIFVIMITLFIMAIGLFLANYITHTIADKMMANPTLSKVPQFNETVNGGAIASNRFDYVFFALFIGFFLFILVSGWLVSGHPIFAPFYIILSIIAVIISPILSNFWEYLSTKPIFTATLNYFPITNHIMLNLPVYLAIFAICGMIVLYGKPYMGFTENEQV